MERFFFTAAIILICSCSTKKDEVPSDILSHTQMVGILIDVHISEAKVSQIKVNNDSSRKVFAIYEKDLFKRHGVSDSAYKKSYEYYLDHPEHMEKIYTAVVDSLSFRERLMNTD